MILWFLLPCCVYPKFKPVVHAAKCSKAWQKLSWKSYRFACVFWLSALEVPSKSKLPSHIWYCFVPLLNLRHQQHGEETLSSWQALLRMGAPAPLRVPSWSAGELPWHSLEAPVFLSSSRSLYLDTLHHAALWAQNKWGGASLWTHTELKPDRRASL